MLTLKGVKLQLNIYFVRKFANNYHQRKRKYIPNKLTIPEGQWYVFVNYARL